MHNAKSMSTPLATHFTLSLALCSESNDDIEYMTRVLYSSLVGSLIYAMVYSYSGLCHALSYVSIFKTNSVKEHWRAI